MFDSIRSRKWFVQAFLLVIALSFALWGVESYLRDMSGPDDIGKVGDTRITQGEFGQMLREQQEQLAAALGDRYTPDLLNTPEARRALIEQIVNQRLLLIDARENGVVVSEELLRQIIQGIPSLNDSGKFSMERYEAMARQRGYSLAGFEDQLRRDLIMQQVLASVSNSAVSSRVAFAGTYGLLAEKREVAELRLQPDDYADGIKVADEEIAKYYEQNAARYELPEQLRAAWVTLSPETIEQQVTVSDTEARAWYEQNRARYARPEERRASHILIAIDTSATAEAKAEARKRAEDILAQVRARPGDFARLARENSDDPGSAQNGGDLGYFGRGAMVPAFENAAFGLPDGGLSEIVESDFGLHIIKVTGVNPGRDRPFEEVKNEIVGELREQAVQRRYAESAEQFSNLAYEQSDSLKPLEEQFKLKAAESGWIARSASPGTPAPLAHPKVLAALFASEATKDKRNTEAIEIAPRTLVVARVLTHRPAAKQPLAAVREDIRQRLVREAAGKRAAEAGAKRIDDLRAGKGSPAAFPKPVQVSRLAPGGLPQVAARAVLDAPAGKLPAYVGVALPDGSYGLYRISAVAAAPDSGGQEALALRGELTDMQIQQEIRAYLASLRERHKVQINASALEGSRG